MERKNIREGKLPFSMQLLGKQEWKTDSEDEFFDCDDDRVVDDEGTSCKLSKTLRNYIFSLAI